MKGPSDRRTVLLTVDLGSAFAAVFVGVLFRFGPGYQTVWEGILGLPPVSLLATFFALLTFGSFAIAGTYRRETYWSLRTELADLAKGMVLLGALTLSLLFLFKLEDVSRVALATTFVTHTSLAVGVRLLMRGRAHGRVTAGRTTRWLLVGTEERSNEISGLVERHPHLGATVIGVVGDDHGGGSGLQWLGPVSDLPGVLASNVVDEVVVTLDVGDWAKLEGVMAACAEQGKTVRVPLASISPSLLKGRLEELDGAPMWSILATPEHRLALALKRVFDVTVSATLLLLLAPLLAATALALLATEGRPVLFLQWRGGLHGRPFRMIKFRSMVPGAEEMRGELVAANERVGPVFKIADDPRITRLGRWLRKTSVDELPQLWNVLMGHMSLVGPRPQPLEEVESYDLWHRRRLSMRPGITGLWQVKARHDPSFDTWMDLDLEYIDRWSLWLDASVLAKTPRALARTPGT